MKITKNQLRRIISENIRFSRPIPNPEMKSPGEDTPAEKGMKQQFAAKKLKAVHKSLMDMGANARGPMYDEIQNQLVMLEDAMDLLELE